MTGQKKFQKKKIRIFFAFFIGIGAIYWTWQIQRNSAVSSPAQERSQVKSEDALDLSAVEEEHEDPVTLAQEGIQSNVHEEFQVLAEDVYHSIPTSDQMRTLNDDDVHQTSLILSQVGERLGEIAQALSENPNLAEEGARFYDRCLKNSQFPTPIRALCFANLKKIRGDSIDRNSIPEEVQLIAGHL